MAGRAGKELGTRGQQARGGTPTNEPGQRDYVTSGASPEQQRGEDRSTPRGGSSSHGTRVNDYLEPEGSGIVGQGSGANGTGTQGGGEVSMGDPSQGPSEQEGLSSGYSLRSSVNGSPGDAFHQVGIDRPDGGSDRGAGENEHDRLAREGVTAGAAGEDVERAKVESRERATGRVPPHDEDETMDGAASVLGVSGVSGGGSGTTRFDNNR